MGFEKIDETLQGWAIANELKLYKQYKEEEVRVFEISKSNGTRFQIWMDLPDKDGQINVHAWDFKNRRLNLTSSRYELVATLDKALSFTNV